jgi:hypothetical protein
MTVSHVYRSFEVLQRDDGHEVPALGMTLPTEEAAHKAIDESIRRDCQAWLDSYDASRKEVDSTQ